MTISPGAKGLAGYLSANPWITCVEPKPQAAMRLFCFTYAGGSSAVFRDWAGHNLNDIEVCPIEIAGRGQNQKQAPFTSIRLLVEQLAESISSTKQFAFFGHSVGALVAFELARQLRRIGRDLPAHLFASACRGPSVPETDPPRHTMPEPALMEELAKLGGTPPELLGDLETMRVFLPAIRADFALSETYAYQVEDPLACDITALGGIDDREVKRQEIEAWRKETSQQFVLRMFPGDHFYLHSYRIELLEAISKILSMHSIYSGSM